MERLMIRYLLLSSTLLCITACSTGKGGVTVNNEIYFTMDPIIRTATYNTQIDFWGKHLSGLMIFKATSDTSERTIFITETGFKIFDFEFTPHNFSVIYCFSALNKKIIIKTLKRDLGYLSDFHYAAVKSEFRTDSSLTYKFKRGKKFDFYTENRDCRLKRIAHGNDLNSNLVIDFNGMRNADFDTIRIDDHAAHLKINMKQIDK